jgi:hypothetical protein
MFMTYIHAQFQIQYLPSYAVEPKAEYAIYFTQSPSCFTFYNKLRLQQLLVFRESVTTHSFSIILWYAINGASVELQHQNFTQPPYWIY